MQSRSVSCPERDTGKGKCLDSAAQEERNLAERSEEAERRKIGEVARCEQVLEIRRGKGTAMTYLEAYGVGFFLGRNGEVCHIPTVMKVDLAEHDRKPNMSRDLMADFTVGCDRVESTRDTVNTHR